MSFGQKEFDTFGQAVDAEMNVRMKEIHEEMNRNIFGDACIEGYGSVSPVQLSINGRPVKAHIYDGLEDVDV